MGRHHFVGESLRSPAISVYDVDALQRLQGPGFLLQHRRADDQRFTAPSQSSPGAQRLHALQEVFGAHAARLAVLVGHRTVRSDLVRGVRHGDRRTVRHGGRVGAGAVRAVRVLGAEAPVAAASAAFAVQRRDLRLAEVGQNTFAAGGGFQRRAVPGGLSLVVVPQQTVDVLQPGPAATAPLKGPFVADCKEVFFIRVFTLGRETLFSGI